ncbi:MAG: CheA signal transduction histidine kinase [Proteobacteria bacterium]|nr:CheA signal transduction histidine kinase [Pseudomonadota bacterium]
MDISSARDVLVQEARELLASMETALLEMETEGQSSERVNAIFRAAHTIKGSAGLFGLDLIVGFTHVMESVLDRVRSNTLALDASLAAVLLRCGDYLGKLVDAIEAGNDNSDPDPDEQKALMAVLRACLAEAAAPEVQQNSVVLPQSTLEPDGDDAEVTNDNWHLSLRFGPDVLRNGMDPLSFIQYLGGLGEIVYLHTVTEGIPPAEQMDAEICYLGFEIDLRADVDKKKLDDVFEFVREDSCIRILPPHARMTEYIALIDSLPESCHLLGEILVAGGTLTESELSQVLSLQARVSEATGQAPRLGELLIQEHMVQAPVVAAALVKQRQGEEKRSAESRIIKVEAAKLDQLINLVGELVIACAGARILADRSRQVVLSESLGEVSQLVGQIRDRSLDLRMIPIGEVFQRFPRVVRDVSLELGKKIDLVITGAETELDKSMVEKLGDPLTHIVRNAIDHGIESVEAREAAGKSPVGKVHLHAYHESGCIVIEISDDGKGLDADKIRSKAIERGMIAPETVLSESEIFNLIFAAGFSTAEQVTNLSGRGVGMDVVKRAIDQLRGDIELESRPGQGTTLRIRLPLTLAIINGFQVGVGKAVFVVPLDMVDECVEFSAEAGHDYTNLRGQVLPFIRLRALFDVPGTPEGRENIVVVKYAGRRFGIVVDALLGEAQTVIKPLSKLFSQVKGISGSSILGTGDVALIIDVPVLMQQAQIPTSSTKMIVSA